MRGIRLSLGLLLAYLTLPLSASRDLRFDDGWSFRRGPDPNDRQLNGTSCAVGMFCDPLYNASEAAGWVLGVEVPHDWSIEDLPERSDDTSTPVLEIRNGTWNFMRGDCERDEWAALDLDDSEWVRVEVPSDWREPPLSYTDSNATGWYRRAFEVSAEQLQLASTLGFIRLSLGSVASQDVTFVNGVQVGSNWDEDAVAAGEIPCQDQLEFRTYEVPFALLKPTGNTVAVRVYSEGGDAPGGLVDTGAGDLRSGWLDAGASEGGFATGYAVGGFGWYRKTFSISEAATSGNGRTFLRFEGVYMRSTVWLNGRHIGGRPYGYSTFELDLTPYLNGEDDTNVLVVRVDNRGQNSRWYSGSGIMRHVYLKFTPALHADVFGGLSITTPTLTDDRAEVQVVASIRNDGASSDRAVVQVTLANEATGEQVAKTSTPVVVTVGPGDTAHATMSAADGLVIDKPSRWDGLDSPFLYRATVTISSAQENTTETVSTTFGVRTISFDSVLGFQLNGRSLKLKGGCVHHDNGPLGSMALDRAEERKVELLVAQGYNAIRTSHNPPSPAFLAACDKLGVLVMDEAFDTWEWGKNPDDYHLDFDTWWQEDLRTMLLRDRNHPSIIMWSIGNEIPMRDDPDGAALSQELSSFVRAIDPTRAVTSAVPMTTRADDPFFAPLDVAGYNYSPLNYEPDHELFQDRVIVATETFPVWSWQGVENQSWVIGDFIWTAMDYIGESGIGANGFYYTGTEDVRACAADDTVQPFSYHISFCGDIDIVGHRKPQSYYRAVLWNVSNLELAVHAPSPSGSIEPLTPWSWPDERQSWTWPGHEGQPMTVRVFSRADPSVPVKLFLNDTEIEPSDPWSESQADPCCTGDFDYNGRFWDAPFSTTFVVPYAAGELKAVVADDVKSLVTAGQAVALKLTPDRETIKADRSDLSYVTVEVVDADGRLVPHAAVEVVLSVAGGSQGELAAAGSGDPESVRSFRTNSCTTWNGRCMAILRPGGASEPPVVDGAIKLTAHARNHDLESASITVATV